MGHLLSAVSFEPQLLTRCNSAASTQVQGAPRTRGSSTSHLSPGSGKEQGIAKQCGDQKVTHDITTIKKVSGDAPLHSIASVLLLPGQREFLPLPSSCPPYSGHPSLALTKCGENANIEALREDVRGRLPMRFALTVRFHSSAIPSPANHATRHNSS